MAVWNLSYKELVGMKCFTILALLNVGENLKKSLIYNLISKFVLLQKQTPIKNPKSIWMNKLMLSKIKMKNRAYHWFLKTKDQRNCQMYAKYRN